MRIAVLLLSLASLVACRGAPVPQVPVPPSDESRIKALAGTDLELRYLGRSAVRLVHRRDPEEAEVVAPSHGFSVIVSIAWDDSFVVGTSLLGSWDDPDYPGADGDGPDVFAWFIVERNRPGGASTTEGGGIATYELVRKA